MARRRARCDRPYAHALKVERARTLRREMTAAEELLWQGLRGKAAGIRVRTQHVILGWIVDFYFARASLVVEVDGDVHDLQIDEDLRRSLALAEAGLKVLRFRNDEVLVNVRSVIDRIGDELKARIQPRSNGPRG